MGMTHISTPARRVRRFGAMLVVALTVGASATALADRHVRLARREPHVERPSGISFAPGTDNGTVSGTFCEGQDHRFVLRAAAGQTMTVTGIEPGTAFSVFAPDGTQLPGGPGDDDLVSAPGDRRLHDPPSDPDAARSTTYLVHRHDPAARQPNVRHDRADPVRARHGQRDGCWHVLRGPGQPVCAAGGCRSDDDGEHGIEAGTVVQRVRSRRQRSCRAARARRSRTSSPRPATTRSSDGPRRSEVDYVLVHRDDPAAGRGQSQRGSSSRPARSAPPSGTPSCRAAVRRYVLQGGAGQRMAVHVDAADDEQRRSSITAPDGNVLDERRDPTARRPAGEQATTWSRWSPSADPAVYQISFWID